MTYLPACPARERVERTVARRSVRSRRLVFGLRRASASTGWPSRGTPEIASVRLVFGRPCPQTASGRPSCRHAPPASAVRPGAQARRYASPLGAAGPSRDAWERKRRDLRRALHGRLVGSRLNTRVRAAARERVDRTAFPRHAGNRVRAARLRASLPSDGLGKAILPT